MTTEKTSLKETSNDVITEEIQKVPILRFSEFTEDWKTVYLKDISKDVMYGMNSDSKEFDGKNKYVRITDIDENSHKFNTKPLGNYIPCNLKVIKDLLYSRFIGLISSASLLKNIITYH